MRLTLVCVAVVLTALNAADAMAGNKGCPPGLAKKQNGCLPPGQAKKIYGKGDRVRGGYIIGNPRRLGLDSDETYYRVGDYVYRIDRDTREVLDVIGVLVRALD